MHGTQGDRDTYSHVHMYLEDKESNLVRPDMFLHRKRYIQHRQQIHLLCIQESIRMQCYQTGCLQGSLRMLNQHFHGKLYRVDIDCP